jgi:hypothetical protein
MLISMGMCACKHLHIQSKNILHFKMSLLCDFIIMQSLSYNERKTVKLLKFKTLHNRWGNYISKYDITITN